MLQSTSPVVDSCRCEFSFWKWCAGDRNYGTQLWFQNKLTNRDICPSSFRKLAAELACSRCKFSKSRVTTGQCSPFSAVEFVFFPSCTVEEAGSTPCLLHTMGSGYVILSITDNNLGHVYTRKCLTDFKKNDYKPGALKTVCHLFKLFL